MLRNKFDSLIQEPLYWFEPERLREHPRTDFLELLFVNNAHRLPYLCLEASNDFRKKHRIGIVLLGAPGFDRKVKHYNLVGNDVSLFYEYEAPRSEELRQILNLRWRDEAVTIDDAVITIIEEVTHSNIQKALNIQAEIPNLRAEHL